MSVTSYDILQCAANLTQNGNCEAEYRAAIGRAYYAAYHFSNDFHNALSSPGLEPPEDIGGVHSRLIYRLKNPTVSDAEYRKKSKSKAYALQTIKLERVRADYKITESISSDDANTNVALARQICT